MARVLSDKEIKRLFSTVIINGDDECIRPNSYVLRLGTSGEFINTGKEFTLGARTKGIRVPPGHSVGITALETIDFRREAVHAIFPGCDLHGLISPTTDLSREGIVAPTTQIDAGYTGTLNWTIANTSSKEAKFVAGERLFRLTILLLENEEVAELSYTGHYQSQTGYVRSRRRGAPVGMKDSEWEDAFIKGGPEEKVNELISSGYPWNLLGSRLKEVDQQLKTVTEEYSEIHDSIVALNGQVSQIMQRQQDTPETVRRVLREEAGSLQNRWLLGAGSLAVAILGITISLASKESVWNYMISHGAVIGMIAVLVAAIILITMSKQR